MTTTDPLILPGVSETNRIVLAGAGKMGGALLQGWLDAGVAPHTIIVIEPKPSAALRDLAQTSGVTLTDRLVADTGVPAILIMAVKPQVMDDVFIPIAPFAGPETVVMSIAAGRTLDSFARHLSHPAVVRAMPNTPAAIGKGITGAVASASVTEGQRALCTGLLQAVGRVVWVPSEDLIDAVTAVSGSGPAYVFYMVEALAEAGIAAGLDRETAMQLARATVTGAGALLDKTDDQPAAELRANVTSPGGTTAAALDVLMRDPNGLKALMTEAVAAAKKRGRELAG